MPANVLVPDPGYAWLSAAVPLVLAQDLATTPNIFAFASPQQPGIYPAGTTTIVVTVEQRSDAFSFYTTARNPAAERTTNVSLLQQRNARLISALDAVAKQIDGQAMPFPTRSERALEAYADGLSTPDTQTRAQRLKEAVAADPNFGLAYVSLLQVLGARSDPQTENVIAGGAAHRTSFTPLDGARFDLIRARLEHVKLREQVAAASKVLKLAPYDLEALASAGEGTFLEGNARDGEALLKRAIAISPQNADLRRQLAFGLLQTKQFSRAAAAFGELPPEPVTLFDRAIATLLSGDAKAAREIYGSFLGPVGNGDIKTLLQARWLALTGRRSEGSKQLEAAKFQDPRVAALAKSQAVLWLIMDRQFAAARAAAPGGGIEAELLGAGAPSADAWRKKIDAVPSNVAPAWAKQVLTRYGYFLLGFYPQAVEAWQDADQQSGGADLQARTMLAASLRAAGRPDEARKVQVQAFAPDPGDAFSVVSFTQLRSYLGQAE